MFGPGEVRSAGPPGMPFPYSVTVRWRMPGHRVSYRVRAAMDGEAKKGANGLSEGGAATWKLRQGLSRLTKPQSRGDHDLNPGMGRSAALIPAAVLVPVFDNGADIDVLFTKRGIDLSDHAGEISFPGGRIEPTDDDAAAAALRETEEELGLPSRQIEIIGALDLYENSHRISGDAAGGAGRITPHSSTRSARSRRSHSRAARASAESQQLPERGAGRRRQNKAVLFSCLWRLCDLGGHRRDAGEFVRKSKSPRNG